MCNGKREVVGAAAAWIDKGSVALPAFGFAFVNAPVDAGLDRLTGDVALDVGTELRAVLCCG